MTDIHHASILSELNKCMSELSMLQSGHVYGQGQGRVEAVPSQEITTALIKKIQYIQVALNSVSIMQHECEQSLLRNNSKLKRFCYTFRGVKVFLINFCERLIAMIETPDENAFWGHAQADMNAISSATTQLKGWTSDAVAIDYCDLCIEVFSSINVYSMYIDENFKLYDFIPEFLHKIGQRMQIFYGVLEANTDNRDHNVKLLRVGIQGVIDAFND